MSAWYGQTEGADLSSLQLICPLDKRPAGLMGGMIGLLWEVIWTPFLASVGDSGGAMMIFKIFFPLTGCMSGHPACFGGKLQGFVLLC